MQKDKIEQLLSYKLMLDYGDDELIKKVSAFLKAYNQNKDGFSFRLVEREDDEPEKFTKAILNFTNKEIEQQLDIIVDFSLDHPLFCGSLNGAQYKLIKYIEQTKFSLASDSKIDCLVVEKTSSSMHPNVITKRGTIFKGTLETRRENGISLNENENA